MLTLIIYLILALISGLIAGTITGLTPGIHVNLIAILIASTFLLNLASPLVIAVFIISMAITHTFLDFIPSVFLGAPDEDTALSILPAHRLLLKGKGQQAVLLTLIGSALGVLIILILVPLSLYFLPKLYPYLRTVTPYILILVSILMILKDDKKTLALIIFFLAGFLGIAVLNLNLNQPLLPLLTGLFGSSALITSLLKKEKIPKQEKIKIKIKKTKKKFNNLKLKTNQLIKKLGIDKKSILKSSIGSIISSPFCCFLPGLGASQAAIIGNEFLGELNEKEFLILLGGINTIVAGLSFIALYSISITRTGTSVIIRDLLRFSAQDIIFIILTIIISGLVSIFITIYFSKLFAKNINKFNYKKISVTILIVLALLSVIFSGLLGLIVFITATFIGLTAILFKVKRTHLMGSLIMYLILINLIF